MGIDEFEDRANLCLQIKDDCQDDDDDYQDDDAEMENRDEELARAVEPTNDEYWDDSAEKVWHEERAKLERLVEEPPVDQKYLAKMQKEEEIADELVKDPDEIKWEKVFVKQDPATFKEATPFTHVFNKKKDPIVWDICGATEAISNCQSFAVVLKKNFKDGTIINPSILYLRVLYSTGPGKIRSICRILSTIGLGLLNQHDRLL